MAILACQGDASPLLEPGIPARIPFLCKSAMASNIDWIQVLPVLQVSIEDCEDGFGTMCFYEGEKEIGEEVCFYKQETGTRFLYLFLGGELLTVEVDGKSGEVSLGWELPGR